ncbi:ADP-ribosylglycohydrolase family protein, partial [Myxococcota bacterium]|nr:ADP-ribosylglycohydrolase family protein [Myxococcota bacterium]
MKTLTSTDSPIYLDNIVTHQNEAGDTAGHTAKVGLSICPGKKTLGTLVRWQRDLDQDLAELKGQDVNMIVSLVTLEEMDRLQIPTYMDEVEGYNIAFFHFPILDGDVPLSTMHAAALVSMIEHYLSAGVDGETTNILIHCNGGLGRAGTIGACLRLHLGLDESGDAAIRSIRKLRDGRAIETRAQEEFIRDFHKMWGAVRHQKDPLNRFYTSQERRTASLFGLAMGDAFGAPFEFMSAEQIKEKHGTPLGMRAGGMWQKGEFTDDTDLTLCTAQAYSDDGTFLPQNAMSAMADWLNQRPKDVGILTRHALDLYIRGEASALEAGQRALEQHPNSAGNGSLMRCSPTALVRASDDPRLVEESEVLSRLTHADPRCVGSCAAYNVVLAKLIEGSEPMPAIQEALNVIEKRPYDTSEVEEVFERILFSQPFTPPAPGAIGYVIHALEISLRILLMAPTFWQGIQ